MKLKHCALVVPLLVTGLSCGSSSSSKNRAAGGAAPVVKAPAATAGTASQPKRPIDPRERLLGAMVRHLLEVEHLRKRKLDDAVSRKAFARYLELIDHNKLFLLESDVKALRVHERTMDDELRDGTMSLAYDAAAIHARRLAMVTKLVADRLARPFDFTKKEDVEQDPKKLGWARSGAELGERWRKILKLQALGRMVRMKDTLDALAKAQKKGERRPPAALAIRIPKTEAQRAEKVRKDLAETYSARFTRLATAEPIQRAATFINAVTSVYDPHTSYLAPAAKENFHIRMSGSLEGIGAVLREDDHYIRIVRVDLGGAAWRQGELEANDVIVSVAQEGKAPVDVTDMHLDNVVRMIRGPKGTKVILTVKKPDDRIKVIAITRDVVQVETIYARGAILGGDKASPRVGYIHLPRFYGNSRLHRGKTPTRSSAGDVKRLLSTFSKRGVTSAILDLRGNSGGLMYQAVRISGLFIEKGPIVQTRRAEGRVAVLRDNDPSIAFQGNLVVLVDLFTASAAEIVTAALQDYDRAVIVGTAPSTWGKGTVQTVIDFKRRYSAAAAMDKPLGAFKMTVEHFFRPNGASTQWRGVVPDIALPGPAHNYLKVRERDQRNSIPWSSVAPTNYQRWTRAAWKRESLLSRSRARQAKQPLFARYLQRAKRIEARLKNTRASLNRVEWLADRDKRVQAISALTPDTSKEPALFKVKALRYDGSNTPAPRPGRKASDDWRTRWVDGLARDVWVNESLEVLRDMSAAGAAVTR